MTSPSPSSTGVLFQLFTRFRVPKLRCFEDVTFQYMMFQRVDVAARCTRSRPSGRRSSSASAPHEKRKRKNPLYYKSNFGYQALRIRYIMPAKKLDRVFFLAHVKKLFLQKSASALRHLQGELASQYDINRMRGETLGGPREIEGLRMERDRLEGYTDRLRDR